MAVDLGLLAIVAGVAAISLVGFWFESLQLGIGAAAIAVVYLGFESGAPFAENVAWGVLLVVATMFGFKTFQVVT